MKILLVHNSYQQPGGEDVVFDQERRLLERAGHEVIVYQRTNSEAADASPVRRVGLAGNMVWSRNTYREISSLLKERRPDLAHIHNTFFMISPSIYAACRDARVPVVQTLHNYRLLCPAAVFFREGQVCEDCLGHTLWRGVWHGCYRDSRAATGAVTLMLAVHRSLRTWAWGVSSFIALSAFSRRKFVEGGVPEEKIEVKPNFILDDPGCQAQEGTHAVFTGRLSPKERVMTLLDAWQLLPAGIPLRIAGGGSEQPLLEAYARERGLSSVSFYGHLPHCEAVGAIKGARFLVFPSQWYENFPMTIIEAFACGVPVICSRLGVMQEVVADGHTGLHFTPGSAQDLAAKVTWAWAHPERMAEMGRNARAEYEAKYTAENNYKRLMDIYEKALNRTPETEYRYHQRQVIHLSS